jgi:hypothetical protein
MVGFLAGSGGERLSLFLRFNIGANADRVNPENLVVV